MTPETAIKKQIKEYLDKAGWYNFAITQGLRSVKGICDRIAIKNGRVLFIEVKSDKGNLSIEQLHFKDRVVAHGAEYVLARCLGDIIDAIMRGI